MELSFSGKSGYQPNQRVNTVIMTTDSEICEFLEEICKISESIEDNFAVFEHTNDSSKPCELICTETFDWMPDQVVETLIIEADSFKVSFEGSLILNSF